MREWFDSLDPRERLMVSVGAVVAVAMLYFLAIWEPLMQGNDALQADVQDARELNAFVRKAHLEASHQRPGTRPVRNSSNRSLLTVVDDTVKRAGLGNAVKRIQPEGDATVRVWLEGASFDQLARWLDTLQKQEGIVPTESTLDREDKPGLIKARISLERAG